MIPSPLTGDIRHDRAIQAGKSSKNVSKPCSVMNGARSSGRTPFFG
jgi:hypothetical protein